MNTNSAVNNLRGPAADPSSTDDKTKTTTISPGTGDTKGKPPVEPIDKNKNNKKPEITLESVSDEDLKNMKKPLLKKLCKDEGLLCSGKVVDLVNRLFLKKYGHSDKYISMMTKCGVCHASVKVTNTKKTPRKDGSVVVVRQLRCSGRHKHSFSKTEIVPAPKTD